MADYRLYCLNGKGGLGLAELVAARSDEEAIRTARLLKYDALKCEIWQDNRLVASLDAYDLATTNFRR